jgi:cytochrome c5
MANPHHHDHHEHHDPIQDNIDTHPVKLAIGVVIGAVALVVGIIMLVQLAIGAHADHSSKNDPGMKPEAIAKRIAPVASVLIDPSAPAAAPAPAAAATPAVAVAAVSVPPAAAKGGASAGDGKAVYDKVCFACHGTGAAGAPKLGDKAAWAPHLAGGKDHLYASALNGKGAMPPKGGNPALSDADVKAAVDYMAAAAK